MPTSIDANISQGLLYVNLIVLCFLLAAFVIVNKKVELKSVVIFLLINALLWFCTLITPLNEYSYGAAFVYFSLSLMYCLKLKHVALPSYVSKIWVTLNVIMITVSVMIISESPMVTRFIVDYYSSFYPELVPTMMFFQKPVLTFSTHSVAGFYHYLFFYLNFKVFLATKQKLYFIFSLTYLYFCYMVSSTTGYLFMLIGIVQLLHYFFAQRMPRAVMTGIVLGLLVMFNMDTVTNLYNNIAFSINQKMGSDISGFNGRLGEEGNLQNNLNYIVNNPFRPLGIGYSKEFMYADSGFIETTLRGSILLTMVVYAGFFLFLKKSLHSAKTTYFVFFIFLLFEIGFSNLIYFRTIYLLPVILVFLNHVESLKEAKTMTPQIAQKRAA